MVVPATMHTHHWVRPGPQMPCKVIMLKLHGEWRCCIAIPSILPIPGVTMLKVVFFAANLANAPPCKAD